MKGTQFFFDKLQFIYLFFLILFIVDFFVCFVYTTFIITLYYLEKKNLWKRLMIRKEYRQFKE